MILLYYFSRTKRTITHTCLETLFMDQTFLKQNCRNLYKISYNQ
uniref:Uncharacterized protein n=1 Tax=Podoviridae sp. ctG4L18 TaxID=2825234 RepID=A0A8S5UPG2_9CAUD|nr:MAG TPA: hypothetical protein [Podoviridae sp. ctG4L18]DAO74382.1 MAG TPA: hypothetical protein [Bacteriophage sp.]